MLLDNAELFERWRLYKTVGRVKYHDVTLSTHVLECSS